ncbi:DUF485 domain-containing protein [Daejeonella lutea]|uniref:Uncharacterized membrane protein, DUF485 family n=1 Tax=Daejeonella lutea TaxID=572036 RepID=A0A1T5AB91_9SPHI|nr:DUF485 domain-containing protein [Daejeonella lutea]SKB32027.1 Uncharacterized membrane protein, DUF485 family [Daejeonella lutea]
MSKTKTHEVLQSPAFQKLVKNRWSISLTFTFLMLFVYIGFLMVVAYQKETLKMPIGDSLNLAIIVGLGIIIFSWLITGVYVYWANNYYDAAVKEIKKDL